MLIFKRGDFMDYYSLDHLKHIFEKNLDVQLLAEDLDYCYLDDNALEIKKKLKKYDYDVIGVKSNNKIIGYVTQADLQTGKIKNYIQTFTTNELISDSTPLIELIYILKDSPYVFVLAGSFQYKKSLNLN